MSKEAMLYESQPENKVRCNLCGRRCLISEGALGVCAARKNVKGKLYALSYARACSVNIDPIEKKPLFHFNPGSKVLSIASPFCNFFCRFCCNWSISQKRSTTQTSEMSPESVVKTAKRLHCAGISYTYTEPTTFFEWAYDSAKLAHDSSLFNTFVTNGYITPEAVDTISPYLDAATVDFKGTGSPIFYKEVMKVPSMDPIYQCLKAMKRNSIHLEVTNLIVPRIGDSKERLLELAHWIVDNLEADTPMHLLRFFPSGEMLETEETTIASVEEARNICLEAGLRYVYTGNTSGLEGENTHCPNCQELLIERHDSSVTKWELKDDRTCPKCGTKLPIKGKYYGSLRR